MWLASEMAAFAHVCELKSFTAAARLLGVPKVAVSRAIVSLERRLGTRLLTRTTRRVSVTPAGELLRPHCQRLLVEVEAVRSQFAPTPGASRRLRLWVDPGYGRLLVTPLVPRFLERYADVALSVTVVDPLPLAASSDWDLTIGNAARNASLEAREPPAARASAGLIATPLGRPLLMLCATPAYLARHGRPRKPADLTAHAVLRVAGGQTLRLHRSIGEPRGHSARASPPHELTQELHLRPALQVDDPSLVHASVAAGLGIGVLPEFLCRQGLAMGKLERVLPEWAPDEPLELQALHLASSTGASVVRQFLEFLLANMIPVLAGAAVGATADAGTRAGTTASKRPQREGGGHAR